MALKFFWKGKLVLKYTANHIYCTVLFGLFSSIFSSLELKRESIVLWTDRNKCDFRRWNLYPFLQLWNSVLCKFQHQFFKACHCWWVLRWPVRLHLLYPGTICNFLFWSFLKNVSCRAGCCFHSTWLSCFFSTFPCTPPLRLHTLNTQQHSWGGGGGGQHIWACVSGRLRSISRVAGQPDFAGPLPATGRTL